MSAKKNPRVGIKPGTHTMQVSFRSETPEFRRLCHDVRLMYRRRMFSQSQIAGMFELSLSLVGKMVRTDPKAPEQSK